MISSGNTYLFADWTAVLRSNVCQKLGHDVYLNNPCDPWGNPSSDPPRARPHTATFLHHDLDPSKSPDDQWHPNGWTCYVKRFQAHPWMALGMLLGHLNPSNPLLPSQCFPPSDP